MATKTLSSSPIWLAESETILCEKATYLSNLMADGKLALICGLMDDSSMTCTEPYFIISGSPFTLGSRHMKLIHLAVFLLNLVIINYVIQYKASLF